MRLAVRQARRQHVRDEHIFVRHSEVTLGSLEIVVRSMVWDLTFTPTTRAPASVNAAPQA